MAMNNLLEYLAWRGDIPFESVGPSDADYAVFCSLSYIPFDGIIDRKARGRYLKLEEAAGRVLERLGKDGERAETHHPADRELLLAVTVSPRFAELKIGHYVEIFNAEKQEQFCAVTFLLPGGDMMVAYRGTDKTIIGWKEDFNMGFMDALPSQIDALEYLRELASARTGRFFCC